MTPPVIAVIGAGNMGSSLIGSLIKNGHPGDKLWATDSSEEKCEAIKKKFHVQVTSDNTRAAQAADIVLLAIKPQYFSQVATEIAPVIQTRKPLVISIAAGIRVKSIEQWLGAHIPVVRAMPNTPALIGCGATALYANSFVSEALRNTAESILRAAGVVVWLQDEKLMDVITALSGSGPAYFFLMMESLQQSAIELGLPEEIARLLTLQTALGAVRMAIESDTPLDILRHQVTSPGGTTEKALNVLEKKNIRGMFKEALSAAKERSEELSNM
jgi:pyrroline-5-carboxylate reductase